MMLAYLKQYLRHKLRDPSHKENSRVPHSSPPSGAAKGRHTRWDDSGGRQVHSKLGCLQVVTPQPSVLLTSVPVEVPPESANIRRDTETRGTVTSEDSLASKIARRNPRGWRGGVGGGRGGGDRHKGRYCGSCIQVTIYTGTESSRDKFQARQLYSGALPFVHPTMTFWHVKVGAVFQLC